MLICSQYHPMCVEVVYCPCQCWPASKAVSVSIWGGSGHHRILTEDLILFDHSSFFYAHWSPSLVYFAVLMLRGFVVSNRGRKFNRMGQKCGSKRRGLEILIYRNWY